MSETIVVVRRFLCSYTTHMKLCLDRQPRLWMARLLPATVIKPLNPFSESILIARSLRSKWDSRFLHQPLAALLSAFQVLILVPHKHSLSGGIKLNSNLFLRQKDANFLNRDVLFFGSTSSIIIENRTFMKTTAFIFLWKESFLSISVCATVSESIVKNIVFDWAFCSLCNINFPYTYYRNTIFEILFCSSKCSKSNRKTLQVAKGTGTSLRSWKSSQTNVITEWKG